MLVTIFVFVLFLFMIMLLFIYNLGVEREKNNKLLEENLLSHMESQQYELHSCFGQRAAYNEA